MRHDMRGPDGEVREVILAPADNGLILDGTDIRFEKASADSLWVVAGDGQKSLAQCAKVGDYWWIHFKGKISKLERVEAGGLGQVQGDAGLSAPMPGTILEIMVSEGDEVVSGQAIMVMEAMKMEHRITAPRDGTIQSIHFAVGERCEQGAPLITMAET